MKVSIPAKEVDVCDLCRRETTVLDTCLWCNKQFCLVCKGLMIGCVHTLNVCKNCADDKDLQKIVRDFAPLIQKVILARDLEIVMQGEEKRGIDQ